jgi:hypothetical protein
MWTHVRERQVDSHRGFGETNTPVDRRTILLWALAKQFSYRASLGCKRSNKRHKEIFAPSWSWAAVSGPIVFPKAFKSAEELDTVLTARAEVMHIVDPYDAVIDGKQMANLQWLNGLALLVLGGQVKMTLVSGMPTEGKNGQYIPML